MSQSNQEGLQIRAKNEITKRQAMVIGILCLGAAAALGLPLKLYERRFVGETFIAIGLLCAGLLSLITAVRIQIAEIRADNEESTSDYSV